MRALDLTGERYGRLVAIKKVGTDKNKSTLWLFKCDCGNEAIKPAKEVRQGHIKSCGCMGKERVDRFIKQYCEPTHGDYGKRLYRIWQGMKARCYCKSATGYKYYKDVKVCSEWMDYKVFRDWALNNGYTDSLTLDRINTHGNYEPNNCRWVSRLVQSNNRNYNRKISYMGIEKSMTEWLRILGYKSNSTFYRLSKKGMSDVEIVEKMIKEKGVNDGKLAIQL